MVHVVEDYYDMPVDELPSANFAGRPISEIDMLGGFWTMGTYSSFSSSDEADSGDDNDNDDGDKDDRASPQRRDLSRPWHPPPKLGVQRSAEKGPSTTSVLSRLNDISVGSGVRGPCGRGAVWQETGSLEAQASPPFERSRAGHGGARLGYRDSMARRARKKMRAQSCDEIGRTTAARPGTKKRAWSGPRGGGQAISPWTRPLGMLDTSGLAASPSSCSMLSTPREMYPASQAPARPLFCDALDVAGARNIDSPDAKTPAREQQRRDSVATTLHEKHDCAEPSGHHPEDDIVAFFEDMGVAVEASEACLDRFWLRPWHSSCTEEDNKTPDASLSGPSSISRTSTQSVGEAKAEAGSRLSPSSSAPSCPAPVSRPERRKRTRLRDWLLLSPGLPGAAFGRAPAS